MHNCFAILHPIIRETARAIDYVLSDFRVNLRSEGLGPRQPRSLRWLMPVPTACLFCRRLQPSGLSTSPRSSFINDEYDFEVGLRFRLPFH